MILNLIDIEHWNRKPYYEHYLNYVRCTYSMTVNLDITNLLEEIKRQQLKFYPVVIYMITTIVNKRKEFRTSLNENGELGYCEVIHPCYTIFHKDDESFSNIWTEYDKDFLVFYKSYCNDMEKYGYIKQFSAKDNVPENIFPISCIPWVSFTGFNLNIYTDENFLLPIFTIGRYFKQEEKMLIPISIQVHHAVCDGYHVSRFINDMQELAMDYEQWI